MAYFDPSKSTEIIVGASPVGLGAISTQEGRIVSYASRALTDVEQRDSQTDLEMLAVVYGVEHYHLYLFGSTFTVVTDHKPLLGILKSRKPATARVECWRLRLMPYEFDLLYRPGKDERNPADFISRHPHTAWERQCRWSLRQVRQQERSSQNNDLWRNWNCYTTGSPVPETEDGSWNKQVERSWPFLFCAF